MKRISGIMLLALLVSTSALGATLKTVVHEGETRSAKITSVEDVGHSDLLIKTSEDGPTCLLRPGVLRLKKQDPMTIARALVESNMEFRCYYDREKKFLWYNYIFRAAQ
jgi:hypothetical protein